MIDKNREVLLIAGQVREIVFDAVMDLGRAIDRAEKTPSDENLKRLAQEEGRKVAGMALSLARRFG